MACSSVVWYLQSMNDALGLISNPAPAHTQRLLVRFLSRLVTGILLCLSYQDEEEEEEGEKEMKRGRIKRKSSRQLLFSFPFNPPCVTSNLKRQVRWAQCVKQKKPHEELIRHLKTSWAHAASHSVPLTYREHKWAPQRLTTLKCKYPLLLDGIRKGTSYRKAAWCATVAHHSLVQNVCWPHSQSVYVTHFSGWGLWEITGGAAETAQRLGAQDALPEHRS